MKHSDIIFLRKLLLAVLIIAASALTLSCTASFYRFLLIIPLGIMYAHLIELQHQCIHRTAFENKYINDLIGFLVGIPFFISFSEYKKSHLNHHVSLGLSSNKEFIDYQINKKNFLWSLFCINRFSLKKINFSNLSKKMILEKIAIITLAIFFLLLSPANFILVWILPLLLIAHPVHFLIELPEHFGCEMESGDVFRNTRSITNPSNFMKWISNYNHLHVEHHRFQYIIPENLLKKSQKHQNRIIYKSHNYIQFYIEYSKFLRS